MAAPVGILKRNLLDLYYGKFTAPTPDQQLRLENLAAMDDNGMPTSPEDMASLGSVEGWSVDNPPDRFLEVSMGCFEGR